MVDAYRGRTVALTLTVSVALLLGGCASSGSAAATSTPVSTPPPLHGTVNPGGPNLPLATAVPQVAASATAGSARAQAGAADICAESVNITTVPPATLPTYPTAQLHLTEVNAGDSFFGYCVKAAPGAIAQWYAQQLPGKGWQQVSTTPIQDVRQLSAVQGSTRLVLTVAPDALLLGQTTITAEMLAR